MYTSMMYMYIHVPITAVRGDFLLLRCIHCCIAAAPAVCIRCDSLLMNTVSLFYGLSFNGLCLVPVEWVSKQEMCDGGRREKEQGPLLADLLVPAERGRSRVPQSMFPCTHCFHNT